MDTSTFWDGKSTIGLRAAVKFERDSCSSTDAAPPRSCKEERSLFQYCDGNLNFATVASEDDDFSFNNKKKGILSRDPMSHRIIEKRRRDRMNNCLADLSRLIPADYLKKGRGRIEKTEIIEMAIKHMKHLQSQGSTSKTDSSDASQPPSQDESVDLTAASSCNYSSAATSAAASEHYRLGYQECAADVMHFVLEVEGFFAGDSLCMELIRHLQKHCDKIINGDRLIYPRTHVNHVNHVNHVSHMSHETASNSSGSITGSPHHNTNKNNNNHNTASSALGSPNPGESSSDFNPIENQHKQNKIEITYDSNSQAEKNNTTQQSQLRDMLTCPNVTSNNQTTKRNHTANNSTTHDPTLYKFKNNIKQRFSAEHDKRRRFETPELKRRNSDTCSVPSSLPSPDLPHSPPPKTYGIPIFALHSKGSYYLPLTLDSEMLSPFFNELNAETPDEEMGQILHPVTISVNFPQSHCRYVRPSVAEGSVWSEDRDRLPLSLPTWHQCEGSTTATFNKRL